MLKRGAERRKRVFRCLSVARKGKKEFFRCLSVARKGEKEILGASARRGKTKKRFLVLKRGAERRKRDL